MTLQIDDILAGQWIAVTSWRRERQACEWSWFEQPAYPPLAGSPLKVIAISLPFLVVEAGGQIGRIDTREFSFARITDEYVAALSVAPKQLKPGRRTDGCPRCGSRLIQRNTGTGAWDRFCRECNAFVGETP